MKKFIEPPNMGFSHIRALFSTKIYAYNKESLAREFNIPKDKIYFPVQRHTNKIHVLESDFKRVVADSVLTRGKGIVIGVQVADCLPILLYDKHKSIIAAVHAGWRGTAGQILKNTIFTMQEKFQSLTKDIMIAIGPGIKKCCYEVGEEVLKAIYEATGEGTYYIEKGDKYFIDLTSANMIQALSLGIVKKHIWNLNDCTCCNPDRFYSYRYAQGTTGRQYGLIGLL